MEKRGGERGSLINCVIDNFLKTTPSGRRDEEGDGDTGSMIIIWLCRHNCRLIERWIKKLIDMKFERIIFVDMCRNMERERETERQRERQTDRQTDRAKVRQIEKERRRGGRRMKERNVKRKKR